MSLKLKNIYKKYIRNVIEVHANIVVDAASKKNIISKISFSCWTAVY